MIDEKAKVIRVWVDHRRQSVQVDAADDADRLLRCEFDPRNFHALVRNNFGPPPFTPDAEEMRQAIARFLAGQRWEDPRQTYRAAAIEIVRPYVSRYLQGAAVSKEAAGAMLDMRDWPSQKRGESE